MSSPATTVNALMQWLMGLFHLVLPTLPLSGIWSRFTALWELPITGKLPDPSQPLPWNIAVEPEWSMPVSGVRLVPSRISILVNDSGGSPQIRVPLVRRRKRKRDPKRQTGSPPLPSRRPPIRRPRV